MALFALGQGFVLGASMIIPIGVQNAYVLNQGIKRNHHFLTATICMLCDVALISLGIFGGGKLIAANEWLMLIIGWGGVAFLLSYAGLAFRSAFRNNYAPPSEVKTLTNRKAVALTTLAVTLLNPHVYLDTVVILGSVGGTFEGNEKLAFALGTILASIVWFYSLAGGAAKLSPWLSKGSVQRCVDVFIGCIMLFVAYTLFTSMLR